MTVPRRTFLQFAGAAAITPAFSRVARAQAYPTRKGLRASGPCQRQLIRCKERKVDLTGHQVLHRGSCAANLGRIDDADDIRLQASELQLDCTTVSVHCALIPNSLMIGHHFSASAFTSAASASDREYRQNPCDHRSLPFDTLVVCPV
jgi:hypothetical protein